MSIDLRQIAAAAKASDELPRLEYYLAQDSFYLEFWRDDEIRIAAAYAVARILRQRNQKIIFCSASYQQVRLALRTCRDILSDSGLASGRIIQWTETDMVRLTFNDSTIIGLSSSYLSAKICGIRATTVIVLNPAGVGREDCDMLIRGLAAVSTGPGPADIQKVGPRRMWPQSIEFTTEVSDGDQHASEKVTMHFTPSV